MAKKQFSTPDDLISSLDDLSSARPSAKSPSRRGRKTFVEENDHQPSARDIALATDDRSMAARRLSRNELESNVFMAAQS